MPIKDKILTFTFSIQQLSAEWSPVVVFLFMFFCDSRTKPSAPALSQPLIVYCYPELT